ncbi:MAG TPA: hypothetical protein VNG33_21905 [Polyangiaceae bacterium]|nr:hypothetical protein [Polyangiaceae bacterium]
MFTSENLVQRAARWFSVAVLAGAGTLVSPAGVRPALAETFVDVQTAPPVTRVEVVPVRPSPRHVWIRGYWGWDGYHHLWVPGHYVLARRGYVYVEPRWEAAGRGHWHWHRGGWHRR